MAYQVNGTTRISDTSVVSGTFNGTTVDGTIVYGSTGIRLPSVASDAGRPASPPVGLMIWRSDSNKVEIWDGTKWASVGGSVAQTFAQTLGTFNYTGGDQTLAIPATATNTAPVTAVRVKMWGAGGTGGGRCSDGTSGGNGSCGSFVDAIFAVTAGETLTIRVGNGVAYSGNDGNCLGQNNSSYGANSCGNAGGSGDGGGANGNSGGSGGGGSSIWRGSTEIIRAAGGGGGGGCGYGGTRTFTANSAESNGAGGAGRGAGGAGGSGGNNCGGGGGGGSGSSRNQGGGNPGNKNSSLIPSNTTAYSGAPQAASSGSGVTPSGGADSAYATNVATGGQGGAASGSNGVGQRGGGPGRVVVLI